MYLVKKNERYPQIKVNSFLRLWEALYIRSYGPFELKIVINLCLKNGKYKCLLICSKFNPNIHQFNLITLINIKNLPNVVNGQALKIHVQN